MKRKRFTEEQIAFALRQAESGTSVEEIFRKMSVSEPTFYRWKKLYGVPSPHLVPPPGSTRVQAAGAGRSCAAAKVAGRCATRTRSASHPARFIISCRLCWDRPPG